MTPSYRPDIDGLRAIAVLSVVFFHSGLGILSGGYVGVDIFFVISGYLITTIILRELEDNNFSLLRFYERRCRRIFPALVVVMLFSLLVGIFLLHPRDLERLAQSAIATTFFGSNIFFYFGTGYFDVASELKPLLHTWSLAIEEQYYIVFPLLLILIARFQAKRYTAWLTLLLMVLFISVVIVTRRDPDAAFFVSPYRAWELLIGGLLAIGTIPVPGSRIIRELLAGVGLLMIVYSVVFFTRELEFPGYYALVPTLGTALVIHAGTAGNTLTAKLLALRPMVFIGLISYSLYLWHWPILVYTRYYSVANLEPDQIALTLAIIIMVSAASWKFVETPIRSKTLLGRRNRLFAASAAAGFAVVVAAAMISQQKGLPGRFEASPEDTYGSEDTEWAHWTGCGGAVRRLKTDRGLCRLGKEEQPATFLVWGDSHARALASSIDASARRYQVAGEMAFKIGCYPLIQIDRVRRRGCGKFSDHVIRYLKRSDNIRDVILVSRWTMAANGTRYKNEGGKDIRLIDLQAEDTHRLSNFEIFEAGIRRTVARLKELGKNVVLVTPVPEVGYDVPSAHFVTRISGRSVDAIVAPTLAEYRARAEGVLSIFASLEQDRSVRIVDPASLLCDSQHCSVTRRNVALYRDDDHLSTFGAGYVSPVFDRIFVGGNRDAVE